MPDVAPGSTVIIPATKLNWRGPFFETEAEAQSYVDSQTPKWTVRENLIVIASNDNPNGWSVGRTGESNLIVTIPKNAAVQNPAIGWEGEWVYGESFGGWTVGLYYYGGYLSVVCLTVSIQSNRLSVENLGGGQWKHTYKANGVPTGGNSPFFYSWTLPSGATLESGTLSSQSLTFSMTTSNSGGATGTLSLSISDSDTPTPCSANASIELSDAQNGPPPEPCPDSGNGPGDDCECQNNQNSDTPPCNVSCSGNNNVGSGSPATGNCASSASPVGGGLRSF